MPTTIVVLNPHAGRSGSGLEGLIRASVDGSVEIARTAYPGHAAEIARRAVREGYSTVVAAGGDGTVNEVLPVLTGSQTALGIIPAGTANDLARHLGLPRDVGQACAVLRTGVRRAIDVLSVNNRLFVTGGGVGLACEVAHFAGRLKRMHYVGYLVTRLLKSWVYLAGALWAVFSKRDHGLNVTVESPSGTVAASALTLTICNQPCMGRRFRVSPGAVNDDGLFDVCLIRNSLSRSAVLHILKQAMTGAHTRSPIVTCWRSRNVRIKLDRPHQFLLDGEVIPAARTLDVGILPAALNMIVPVSRA